MYLMFPDDLVEAMHYWEGTQRDDAVSSAMHHIRGRMVPVYITCDVNLEPLARVWSAKIVHCYL